jgi:hypothetical protein
MRVYLREEEERIRVQRLVREWADEGRFDAPQAARLLADVRVDLRRTNPFLRAGLALFTLLIVGATVGLAATSLGVYDDGRPFAVLAGVFAAGCVALAEYLIRAYRWYRHGVEEALAAAAVLLFVVSTLALTWPAQRPLVPWLVGAAGGFAVYRRYGFVYAAIAALACTAAIPFQFQLSPAVQRSLAAALLGAAGVTARAKRLHYGDDYPGDEYGDLQAAALAGVYLALNVQLTPNWYAVSGWFYWLTYVGIWIVPVAGLYVGAREKDRMLIDVGLALLVMTLVTNKPYLGWERHTWDPCLLGVVAVAVAMAVRRWLASGPGGVRHGFTPLALVGRDRSTLSALGMASAALPTGATASSSGGSTPPTFGGGRSGGAGGGGSF